MSIDEILFQLAEGATYDSEYDGRTYTYCKYCDMCQDNRTQHEDDCLQLQAQQQLGDKWTNHLAEQAKIKQDEQHELDRTAFIRSQRRAKVICEFCGKQVVSHGLIDHQLRSNKCRSKRNLPPNEVVQAKSQPTVMIIKPNAQPELVVAKVPNKYPNRPCLCCKRTMVNAHPNKKFCSNTGEGNCKDRHHNATNPRGMVGEFLALKRELAIEESEYDEEDEHGHPFASGWDGHGQS